METPKHEHKVEEKHSHENKAETVKTESQKSEVQKHENKDETIKTESHRSEEHTHEHKTEEKKEGEKNKGKVENTKTEAKKEQVKKIVKKEEAIARGTSLSLSKRHCMYLCTFIKNKKIDQAIADLELVIKFKKPVPFKGEIPHRKGMMSGRYPINASMGFIKLLKSLRGNSLMNGLDLEKTKISYGSANWAHRPMRTENRRAKRTNVLIKAREMEDN